MSTRRTTWRVIGRGKVGWHADGTSDGNKVSGSGGSLQSYLDESEAGTVVYDAMETDDADFAHWVIAGPMLDPTLLPGEVRRLYEKTTLARMLPGLGGAFKAIGVQALLENDDTKFGSMDFVAMDLYMAMMKVKVPGIKLGKVNDQHQVVWE